MGYGGRKFDQNDSRGGGGNKWGGGPGGPKSLMDMNFNSGNNYRPRGPPPNHQGGGGWNQHRPRGGGPRGPGGPNGPRNNGPWQNGPPPRGIDFIDFAQFSNNSTVLITRFGIAILRFSFRDPILMSTIYQKFIIFDFRSTKQLHGRST